MKRGVREATDLREVDRMSSPAAVAQKALDDSQTLALVGQPVRSLEILLSALHHIASGGKRESERWAGLKKEWRDQ